MPTGERSTTPRPDTSIVNAKLDMVLERIDRLENSITCFSNVQAELEKSAIQQHAVLDSKSTAAHSRIDDHERRLQEVERIIRDIPALVQQMKVVMGIGVFLGSTFGVVLIGFIWALITHQVKVP